MYVIFQRAALALLFLGTAAQAADVGGGYRHFQPVSPKIPAAWIADISFRFLEAGWYPIDSTFEGNLPFLGVDQVFFSRELNAFVLLKFGVELSNLSDLDRAFAVGKSYLYHANYSFLSDAETPQTMMFLLSQAASESEASRLMRGILERKPKRKSGGDHAFWDLLIPEAKANCSIGSVLDGQQGAMLGSALVISGTMANPMDLECTLAKLRGAWNATGGAVVGIAAGAWNLGKEWAAFYPGWVARHPVRTMVAPLMGQPVPFAAVEEFLRPKMQNFVDAMEELWKQVDPAMIPVVRQFLIEHPRQVANFLCEMQAEVGIGVLIAVLTQGAGSAKLLLKAEWAVNLITKLGRLARLGEVIPRLPQALRGKILEYALSAKKFTRASEEFIDSAHLFRRLEVPDLAENALGCAFP